MMSVSERPKRSSHVDAVGFDKTLRHTGDVLRRVVSKTRGADEFPIVVPRELPAPQLSLAAAM